MYLNLSMCLFDIDTQATSKNYQHMAFKFQNHLQSPYIPKEQKPMIEESLPEVY